MMCKQTKLLYKKKSRDGTDVFDGSKKTLGPRQREEQRAEVEYATETERWMERKL